MKPSRIEHVLHKLIQTRWPAFVWGPPGVGKSAVVRAVAQSLGMPLIDLRASLLDPTDLRGIPAIENGRAVWCPPSFLPGPDQPPGLLFLDEINAAPPLVQASLYQLVLDRRVGEYELPEGWRIVAAGNRAGDRAVVFRLSSALANRFVHLDFDVDFQDWRTWAVGRGIVPEVIAFLSLRPALLRAEGDDSVAQATPRTWEMASDAIRAFGSARAAQDVLPGIVGEGPATEFMAHARRALAEADFLRISVDPQQAELPDAMGDLYALVAWVASQARDADGRRVAGALLPRLPPELGVLLARDVIRLHPRFTVDPAYRDFARQHRAALDG